MFSQSVLEAKNLDVCFMDPVMIDQFAFQCWLRGDSIADCFKSYEKHPSLKQQNTSFDDMLNNEIISQYRIFDHIEKILANPRLFMEQDSFCEVQLAPSIRKQLIEQYFELDDIVVRELIGKKLTHKVRKDLDDVHEKTNVKITSCRRQFDNLRNVVQYLKTFNYPTPSKCYFSDVIKLIQSEFMLAESLATKYAVILFIGYHRFECNKRKMKDFSYPDLQRFAIHIANNWTNCCNQQQQQNQQSVPAISLMNIDLNFYMLRDLKPTLYDNKTRLSKYESNVIESLSNSAPPMLSEKLTRLKEKFSQLLKSLLVIGAGLVRASELRDFFIDLYEKFCDVLQKHVGLTKSEMILFCEAMITQLASHPMLKPAQKSKFLKIWSLYITTIKNICSEMYGM
jgi:hypothetical protein